jgi:hypothetical protein
MHVLLLNCLIESVSFSLMDFSGFTKKMNSISSFYFKTINRVIVVSNIILGCSIKIVLIIFPP